MSSCNVMLASPSPAVHVDDDYIDPLPLNRSRFLPPGFHS
jgi:hypothetical protein